MKALESIYQEMQPKIYAFFYVKTSNQAVAEDLTHDVFYEACKSIHSFGGKSTIQTWLFSIAKNILKKYYRSKRYKQNLEARLTAESLGDAPSPEKILLEHEEAYHLIKHIQALDDLPKEIITLRIYGELSFKEIGELVQRSENFTRVTFHRTKLKLKKEMEAK